MTNLQWYEFLRHCYAGSHVAARVCVGPRFFLRFRVRSPRRWLVLR